MYNHGIAGTELTKIDNFGLELLGFDKSDAIALSNEFHQLIQSLSNTITQHESTNSEQNDSTNLQQNLQTTYSPSNHSTISSHFDKYWKEEQTENEQKQQQLSFHEMS